MDDKPFRTIGRRFLFGALCWFIFNIAMDTRGAMLILGYPDPIRYPGCFGGAPAQIGPALENSRLRIKLREAEALIKAMSRQIEESRRGPEIPRRRKQQSSIA